MKSIEQYIKSCNDSIDWIRKFKPEQYEQRFIDIVDKRRVLKQWKRTLEDNPAIAAYGKSQVGKSYLMSNLLQDKGKPFMLESDGCKYDFIAQMNPITDKTEATGVVTRFSSFSRCPELYKPEHPIMMRTMSVADLVAVICEGYFNDIEDYTTPSDSEIDALAASLTEKYRNAPHTTDDSITADEVLDLKVYFKKYLNNAQAFNKGTFFDKVALIVENIPASELATVFSCLWNNDPTLTAIFRRLLDLLGRLRFSRHVYLPADALLHRGSNENTVMSVQCLNGLARDNGLTCEVYIPDGPGFITLTDVSKSELSGLCAEIVLKIPDELLRSSDRFDTAMITDNAVLARLERGEIKKDILGRADLLDFPGARSRKNERAAKLVESEVLINVLLRGKVAYLFNKYSEAHMINILMYCHHNESNDVTNIPNLLDNWVDSYIGATPEARAGKIRTLDGIPPLFYVATMFNIDMRYKTENPEANQGAALDGRWEARFQKVLIKDCFGPSTDWWQNWDAPGSFFKNCFLLRDFKYSTEGGSALYGGFTLEGAPESTMLMKQAYYDEMRESFVNSPYVKPFFADPALAWDVAATIRNDGALYIIQRLTAVTALINEFRDRQAAEDVARVVKKVFNIMKDYYVSQDTEVILRENIRKVKAIRREMDIACNHDNYFFGHLLQTLQVDIKETLDLVHRLVQGNELNSQVQAFSDYEIIYTRCDKFEGCGNDEERWERVCNEYGFTDAEEAGSYLQRKGIDPNVLFRRTFERKKNSYIIAEKAIGAWLGAARSVDSMSKAMGDIDFDPIAMGYLIDKLEDTVRKLDLESKLAGTISEYVDVANLSTVNEGLIADVMAQIINEFVMDLGYSYLDEETRALAERTAATDKSLKCEYITRPVVTEVTEEQITSLFNGMAAKDSPLTHAFENSYFRWMEYVVVAFISNLACPDYDREANERLSEILKEIE